MYVSCLTGVKVEFCCLRICEWDWLEQSCGRLNTEIGSYWLSIISVLPMIKQFSNIFTPTLSSLYKKGRKKTLSLNPEIKNGGGGCCQNSTQSIVELYWDLVWEICKNGEDISCCLWDICVWRTGGYKSCLYS